MITAASLTSRPWCLRIQKLHVAEVSIMIIIPSFSLPICCSPQLAPTFHPFPHEVFPSPNLRLPSSDGDHAFPTCIPRILHLQAEQINERRHGEKTCHTSGTDCSLLGSRRASRVKTYRSREPKCYRQDLPRMPCKCFARGSRAPLQHPA